MLSVGKILLDIFYRYNVFNVAEQQRRVHLGVKLCWKSEWLCLNIFHFTHPTSGRLSALFMSQTLFHDTDYQQLLLVCVCVSQTVGIQVVSVFRVLVVASCIFTGCYWSVIMDSRLLGGDFWCLFVCQREKIWQARLFLSFPCRRLPTETSVFTSVRGYVGKKVFTNFCLK